MNNIQQVSNALLCSNCGACKAVCPKDAISFSSTSLGRMSATVNGNCIDCGICIKVCPSLDKQNLHVAFTDRFVGNIENVYVGKCTDAAIFENSQSGGACTAIVTHLFDSKAIDCAVLCKMEYGNPPLVKSVVVDNKNQLADCQKSCYTPVDLLSALRRTGDKKSVAVVGLPCHIQGVESLLRHNKKYHNIHYKIGLICDRTLCAGIQDVMLSYVRHENKKIVWRNKKAQGKDEDCRYTYKNAPVTIVNEDGEQSVLPNSYRFALKDYFTCPRCRVCYDKLNVFSDIVLGDPWGMSDIDWKNGESVVITRTVLGEQLINEMIESNYLSLKNGSIVELFRGQHIDERRMQVSRYSKALKIIPKKVDSYLYRQVDDFNINTRKEENDIIDFMRRDSLTQDELVREARKIIKEYIARQKLNKWFIIRVLHKIKGLF